MGATDVVPFILIRNMTMEEAVELSKETAKAIYERYDIPVFLAKTRDIARQSQPCAHPQRTVRGHEGKIMQPEWPTTESENPSDRRATAACARFPLVAYNIDLDTDNIDIANKIARAIRQSGGGFQHIKAERS